MLRTSDLLTRLASRPGFQVVHVVWFSGWIITRGLGKDPYPFGFLTMVVSLEAIFLSLFVLASQASLANAEQVKIELERRQVEEDLATDRESLALLKRIAEHLGI